MSKSGRRAFLQQSLCATALAALRPRRAFGQAPAIVTPEPARPALQHGAAVGDAVADRAIVWSRADRSARMVVEWSTTESFRDARRVVGPAALEDTGFTARVDLSGLPPGQRVFYRVLFQDLSDLRLWSLPAQGSFLQPPQDRRDFTLAWTADTVGQGWGINPEWGGLRIYDSMRRARPDLFVHVGDTIYADQPLVPEVELDGGKVWRNLVTPAKAKVAESLDEFRGNYLYNLTDEHLRRFNAEVAQAVIWDDHEVLNNWYPTQLLEDPRYQVKSVALLAARARRAFLEHQPIRISAEDPERIYRAIPCGPLLELFCLDLRSYRGANSPNRQATLSDESRILGAGQVEWLKRALAASRATWKVVASDMPIGLVVRDYPNTDHFEAVANGDGPALGRELEIAEILRHVRERRIRNLVWITADVHYCAAHHYHPDRARFTDFHPFWEFVAGPAHAGTFGPNPLDDTFGPRVDFIGIPPGMKPNRPPSEGLQFFGTIRVDGRTEAATVSLHRLDGTRIHERELPPER